MRKLLPILFTLIAFAASAQDTANYKIVIDTSVSINHSGVFNRQVQQSGPGGDSAWVMFDQQNMDTSTISALDNLIYYRSTDTITIDLGGYYALTKIDMTVNSSTGSWYFQRGIPGAWATKVLRNMSSATRWVQMNNAAGVQYTRYLRIYWNSLGSFPRVSELLLYGHLVSDSLPRVSSDNSIDTADYKLALNKSIRYWDGDTVFYQLNDIKGTGLVDSLIDEQGADPQNGIYTPAPKTLFTPGSNTHQGYPAIAIIDLGGYYCVTDKWFYMLAGTDSINIAWGTPFHWSQPMTFYGNGNGWKDVSSKKIYTRYLKVYWSLKGFEKIYEMILYGHLVGPDSLSRTPPAGVYDDSNKQTFANFMGCNIWGGLPFNILDVGNAQREYVNQSYIDTSLYQHNVDSINFVFTKFSTGTYQLTYNFPELTPRITVTMSRRFTDDLRHDKLNGKTRFACLQGPSSLANTYSYGYDIDRAIHPVPDSTDASQYDRLARMGYTMAQVFGRNKYPADSVQSTLPGKDSSGLNLLDYIETGNEMNGTWGSPYQYYSPEMFEAYSSAIYDGNANTMGPGMGIKAADDSMKVVMAGTAGIHPERLKSFYYYSYYRRPDRTLPVDVINFHNYPGNITHSSPEDANWDEVNSFDSVAHQTCPGCEIWMTEWGYCRNHGSVNAVGYVPGRDSAQVQADWVARYWLLLSTTDVDRATYYQIENEPSSQYLDSAGSGQYTSMGLVDGHNGSYYAFPVYYYVHTMYKTLGSYKEDSTIYYNNDSLYVLRYRNVNHPDSVCYAIWSGTQTNRSVSRYFKSGHSGNSVRDIHLEDKKMLGDTTMLASASDSTVQLTITETPQFLFTTEGTDGGTLVPETGPANEAPTANAGPDQTLSPGITTATLTGSGTDADGTIASYSWSVISGSAGISSPSSASTEVTGLQDGKSYTFRLTVTDNDGATGTDDVTITVQSSSTPVKKIVIYNGKVVMYNGKLIMINTTQ